MTELAPGATEVIELHDQPDAKPPWLERHWKLLLIIGTVLAVAGGGALAWSVFRPKPAPAATVVATPSPTPSPTPTPTPITKASPLTGVQVAPEPASRPIVSIIVENHPAARPQSGLADAGVVYEALAEGGITRFQTFFLDNKPVSIGPVRSLRPYFVDWGHEFAAPVAHAGGSADAINLASSTGLRSLNALAIGAPTFFRTRDRVAPHNLYTSGDLITSLLNKRGFNAPATFTPSPRKPDAPSQTPPRPKIHIEYSSYSYSVDYAYNTTTNSYARSMGGKPHLDRTTGKQIQVKNVVVMLTPTSVYDSSGHMRIQTTGRGQGWVMRDGDVVPVTWVKDSRTTRTRLMDASGKDVPLNAGNTWYSIVPTGKTVSF